MSIVQGKIAAAAKEAGVKLFVPFEFRVNAEGETEGNCSPHCSGQRRRQLFGAN